jgi:hypothetical protein
MFCIVQSCLAFADESSTTNHLLCLGHLDEARCVVWKCKNRKRTTSLLCEAHKRELNPVRRCDVVDCDSPCVSTSTHTCAFHQSFCKQPNCTFIVDNRLIDHSRFCAYHAFTQGQLPEEREKICHEYSCKEPGWPVKDNRSLCVKHFELFSPATRIPFVAGPHVRYEPVQDEKNSESKEDEIELMDGLACLNRYCDKRSSRGNLCEDCAAKANAEWSVTDELPDLPDLPECDEDDVYEKFREKRRT